MNAALFPLSRRCVYCAGPAIRDRVCVGHRDLLRIDPWFSPELLIGTTFNAGAGSPERVAPTPEEVTA